MPNLKDKHLKELNVPAVSKKGRPKRNLNDKLLKKREMAPTFVNSDANSDSAVLNVPAPPRVYK